MADVRVIATGPNGIVLSTVSTAPGGRYQFGNLLPGTYVVSVVQPKGYISTNPDSVTLTLDHDARRTLSFGQFPMSGTVYLPLLVQRR